MYPVMKTGPRVSVSTVTSVCPSAWAWASRGPDSGSPEGYGVGWGWVVLVSCSTTRLRSRTLDVSGREGRYLLDEEVRRTDDNVFVETTEVRGGEDPATGVLQWGPDVFTPV